MNKNIIPLPVLSAIVSRFDATLDELHFSDREVKIHINEAHFNEVTENWEVWATHISGAELDIIVTPNFQIKFTVREQ
jgi:hypothetical protein